VLFHLSYAISSQMLGKRSRGKQFSWPDHKRRYLNASAPSAYRGPRNPYYKNTFGKGYDPKRIDNSIGSRMEKKYHETTFSGTLDTSYDGTYPTYRAFNSLNAIASGDGTTSRNGHRIQAYKLSIRGNVGIQAQTQAIWSNLKSGTHRYRVIIYIDTQCNGAATPLAALMQGAPNGGDQFDLFNSLNSVGRIKVLMDKFLSVTPNVSVISGGGDFHQQGVTVQFKKTLTFNLPIQYADGNANMASITTNNIGMIVLCDNAVHQDTALAFRTRLRFTDN